MRHGKSDWSADYGADHERPLNDRGVRSARIIGRVLTAERQAPDLIISSTALRARCTASLANEAGRWDSEIVADPTLYGTGPEAALDAASNAGDSERLMLVGHQPTWSILTSVLTGDRVEMKTGTVALIHLDIDTWKDLPWVKGEISACYQPRDYFGTDFDGA